MPARERTRVLILGGTGEARLLAELLVRETGDRVEAIVSLAGRTAAPAGGAGTHRVGGFGGAAGLCDYLRDESIAAVIDATHPFASRISRHARQAAEICGVPRLVLRRPAWGPTDGDRWIEAADAAAAAAMLPALGRRVWLTFGDGMAAFATVPDTWFLVRRIEPPAAPLPLRHHKVVLERGPFRVDHERALIARHRVEVLVSKASGGAATEAKLVAAREAGLPVVMIRRPPPEPGPAVDTPAEALAWLVAELDGRSSPTA